MYLLLPYFLTYSLYLVLTWISALIPLLWSTIRIISSISVFKNASVISQIAVNLFLDMSIAVVSNSPLVDTIRDEASSSAMYSCCQLPSTQACTLIFPSFISSINWTVLKAPLLSASVNESHFLPLKTASVPSRLHSVDYISTAFCVNHLISCTVEI